MVSQMANIRVPQSWNNETAIMLQEATNLHMDDQHVDDLPVSGEEDDFLHEH